MNKSGLDAHPRQELAPDAPAVLRRGFLLQLWLHDDIHVEHCFVCMAESLAQNHSILSRSAHLPDIALEPELLASVELAKQNFLFF
jgi:hypothetical protein